MGMGLIMGLAGIAGIGYVAHTLTSAYYKARIQAEADFAARRAEMLAKWDSVPDNAPRMIDGVWY